MKIKEVKPDSSIKVFKTKKNIDDKTNWKWWLAKSDKELVNQTLSVASYLKESQGPRNRQAAIFARLYSNQSLFNFAGMSMFKMDSASGLPFDRPTFNLIQSCVDTLVSRIGQSKPIPTFLTDGSKYKERNLAKKLNNFIIGEFYQSKAHEKTSIMLRDALIEGMGIIKVVETSDHKVGLERVLLTELLVDPNDGIYGSPRCIYQTRLVDREVAMDMLPKSKSIIANADTAYPDNSADSSKTVSDQILIVEAWHLPSGKGAKDGRHTIVCSAGKILDEEYNKEKFPFVFLPYSDRLLGFWPQGLAEQLMGTQIEINALLYTISRAIKLVGVPRVFEEMGSKVMAASHNNDVGVIVKYRGTKPIYEVVPCNAPELYQHLERLIQFGYQQAGVSAMQAGAQKPQGLDSGEAQRVYDDISTDRFASLSKKYDNVHIELAYAIIDKACDIAKDQDAPYATIFPHKNGAQEIELPDLDLVKNPFIIQCFNQSSLPRDPAGRMAKITEMIQSGMITIQEGRRLLDYQDIDQIEKLANSREERIYMILDKIVDEGIYTAPDPFTDLELANKIVVNYINVYDMTDLEEEKMQMLRTYFSQVQALKAEAMAPVVQQQQIPPQANPQPLPTSPLVPNGNPVPQG